MANVPLTFTSMNTLDQSIRDLIQDHLRRKGISGRRFGIETLQDTGFVSSFMGGRGLGLKTADRVLAAIGEPPIGPAFLGEVEAFLEIGGTKPYVLGEEAASDASFVDRLREGASFYLVTVEKVRAWMARNADEACLEAMREAVAGVPLLAQKCERRGKTVMHEDEEDEGPRLSAKQAAAWLGIHARTLYRLRKDGIGPDYYRFGWRIVYRQGALRRWAAKHLVKSKRSAANRTVRKRLRSRAKASADAILCLSALPAGMALLGTDAATAASDTAVSGMLGAVTDLASGADGQFSVLLAACGALAALGLLSRAKRVLGSTDVQVSSNADCMVPHDRVLAFRESVGVKDRLVAGGRHRAFEIRSNTVAGA